MHAQKFFTEEEQERIHQAVVAAEQRTSGEIVPMIVGASGRYTEANLGGLVAGLIAGTIGAVIFGDPWAEVQIQLAWPIVGATLGLILCHIPVLKRRLIPKRRIDEAVHERCLAAFTAHGLHYTTANTGVLILASLFERRVQILADRGINEKVPVGTWDEVVRVLTAGLRSRDACTAFCSAIQRCGDILATHFPRHPDDREELDDKLVTED